MMAEETEQPKEETPTEAAPQPENLVEQAAAAAERLEKALKRQEDLMAREEKLLAQKMLGGSSEAGQAKEKAKELTPIEYSNEVLAGRINPLA